MKKIKLTLFILLALFVAGCAPVYTINHSAPVNPISLPEDGAAHYWAQNEWWYYTGHLKAEDGKEYGYELTFFKRITNEDNVPELFIPIPAYWLKDVGMLGHFAVTDITNNKFAATDVNNFLGLPCKADDKKYDLMIDKWTAREEKGKHILYAEMDDYRIELELEPIKPAALHGRNGIVNKGGNNSNYYYSFTNMKTSGTLSIDGKPVKVSGKSWMDHEYGTMKLTYPQTGWDWFSVQLDNSHELMLYVIRNDKDIKSNHIGGTFILPNGKTIPVKAEDIDIKNLDYWHSEQTDSDYPSSWEITVKSLKLKLKCKPVMAEQELDLKPMPYWEGGILISGTYNNKPVKGKGYFELVGYSKKYPINYIN
ncbi:MAG: hypothetical protein NTW65_12900 [Deltaproteobacteria bacterium]|nr:hypothetical protein [Deltaproteobacteria bacterium]